MEKHPKVGGIVCSSLSYCNIKWNAYCTYFIPPNCIPPELIEGYFMLMAAFGLGPERDQSFHCLLATSVVAASLWLLDDREHRALWMWGLDPGGWGWWCGAEERWRQALMIKANFPCPPYRPPSSSSLPFKSGYERRNAKSSLHLRAGQEATAEKDGGSNLPLLRLSLCFIQQSVPVNSQDYLTNYLIIKIKNLFYWYTI